MEAKETEELLSELRLFESNRIDKRDQRGAEVIYQAIKTISDLLTKNAELVRNGHKIRLIGDGELEYCDRCYGGEIELSESCADRLKVQLEEAAQKNAALEAALATEKLRFEESCRDTRKTLRGLEAAEQQVKELREALEELYSRADTAKTSKVKGLHNKVELLLAVEAPTNTEQENNNGR